MNDPDPAHHRPFFLCSASTATCVLTPIAGFNLDGTPVGSGLPPRPVMLPPGYSTDPAHHSTDLNDPDPAHHQPTLEFDEASGTFILTPIPGFDLQGFRVTTTTPAPAPGDGDDGDGTVGNPGDDNPRTGNPGNGNDNGNGNGNPNPGNPVRPFFR